MNEKIYKLAETAGITFTDYGSGEFLDKDDIDTKRLGKFAELIVEECADYANWYQANIRYTDIAKAIKDHFGVEK